MAGKSSEQRKTAAEAERASDHTKTVAVAGKSSEQRKTVVEAKRASDHTKTVWQQSGTRLMASSMQEKTFSSFS